MLQGEVQLETIPQPLLETLRAADAKIAELQRLRDATIQGYVLGKGWQGTHNCNFDLPSGMVTVTLIPAEKK